jgi:hypothetical protein
MKPYVVVTTSPDGEIRAYGTFLTPMDAADAIGALAQRDATEQFISVTQYCFVRLEEAPPPESKEA